MEGGRWALHSSPQARHLRGRAPWPHLTGHPLGERVCPQTFHLGAQTSLFPKGKSENKKFG